MLAIVAPLKAGHTKPSEKAPPPPPPPPLLHVSLLRTQVRQEPACSSHMQVLATSMLTSYCHWCLSCKTWSEVHHILDTTRHCPNISPQPPPPPPPPMRYPTVGSQRVDLTAGDCHDSTRVIKSRLVSLAASKIFVSDSLESSLQADAALSDVWSERGLQWQLTSTLQQGDRQICWNILSAPIRNIRHSSSSLQLSPMSCKSLLSAFEELMQGI